VTANSLSGNDTNVATAAPEFLRQEPQWQWLTQLGSPPAVYATAPHKQWPFVILTSTLAIQNANQNLLLAAESAGAARPFMAMTLKRMQEDSCPAILFSQLKI
jgi:hypothetical protein